TGSNTRRGGSGSAMARPSPARSGSCTARRSPRSWLARRRRHSWPTGRRSSSAGASGSLERLAVRVLHFDCFSGISGDMTLGALIDAGVDAEAIRAVLDSFGLPITLEIDRVKRNGIAATAVNVVAPDQEDYRFLPDVEAILAKG